MRVLYRSVTGLHHGALEAVGFLSCVFSRTAILIIVLVFSFKDGESIRDRGGQSDR